ncbi:MAG: 50S ribosomal protein L4 [Candidatus Magasanikbacteria bacterium RIFCSPLOWO2_02_FULL_44_11]|uniref:Large ribosomal subunit protein uL4 n=2 Tax=Candidatus Magasanikiibacteriota TaxID=1752731 RepID=A0A1F6N9F5_9BACT|nr:MAG: 50S ribosomal protein L4 [Candidatus Magasanikbacteria bacterium RIFCSPHIGHO2_02_FULL_45_10]OGH80554.1 MAG: 50S ribosomal protein L4 [Candidatus Magasanikbacteria bacterium RIFCSPLOWO2_02_FULL_44_11]
MKLKVYTLTGQEKSDITLDDAIFGVAVKPEVVHEVFVAQMNNTREPWADTKNRGEVRGGGKKPWQQKGTGRARHGSIRSPIWKGGGVAFGPLSIRNYKSKINKKTRKLATKMVLADKAQNGALWVVENFDFAEPKTKFFVALLKALPAKQKSFLILTPGKDSKVIRMTGNLDKIATLRAEDANVMELMNKQAVITSVDGLKKLEETLSK